MRQFSFCIDQLKFLRSISLVLLILASNGSWAQAKNGLYAEVYSIRHDFSEGPISLNYERLIGKKENKYIRIGLLPDFESTLSIPITFSGITKPSSNHHLEYGGGLVFRIERFQGETYRDIAAIMIPILYRYQNPSGMLYFRAGINLFVSYPILPSPSFSLGTRF